MKIIPKVKTKRDLGVTVRPNHNVHDNFIFQSHHKFTQFTLNNHLIMRKIAFQIKTSPLTSTFMKIQFVCLG